MGGNALCFTEEGTAKGVEASGILLLAQFPEADTGTGSQEPRTAFTARSSSTYAPWQGMALVHMFIWRG